MLMEAAVLNRRSTTVAGQDYADVFAAHHRRALRLAYLLTTDAAAAEDVVATAFTKVYPHWQRGRVDDVGAYLRRAVANEARSSLRRRYRRRERDAELHGDRRGQLTATERLVEHDAMWAAVRALPERMRQVVVLRYYEDLSERETADVLGVSTGTVKSSLSRGLDRLEQLLTAADADDASTGGGR